MAKKSKLSEDKHEGCMMTRSTSFRCRTSHDAKKLHDFLEAYLYEHQGISRFKDRVTVTMEEKG
jgi:hypothetical protein